MPRTATRSLIDRSDAFKRWFSSHRPKCCVVYTTPKIPIAYAQTLPYGSTSLFVCFGHLHSARPMVCEVNQSAFRLSRKSYAALELLTNSNSIRPAQAERGFQIMGVLYSHFPFGASPAKLPQTPPEPRSEAVGTSGASCLVSNAPRPFLGLHGIAPQSSLSS